MKNFKLTTSLIMLTLIIGCSKVNNEETDIYQNKRDNTLHVKNKITSIETNKIISRSKLRILDNILIISEVRPGTDKGIHLYNKNTFEHIASTGIIGKGPGEIIRQGFIGINHNKKELWVQDHGKRVMWKFYLDSILQNQNYKPSEKIALKESLFIENFGFINDTIVIGRAINVLNHYSFNVAMAKLNLSNNQIERYGYTHPHAVGKKSSFTFSLQKNNNIYVKAHYKCDLLTICDLNGNLKYNVFGPQWLENKENKKDYYYEVKFVDDYIIASYLGKESITYDKYQRPKGNTPTKLLIFDKKGHYIKTIETGHIIDSFCFDEENNRLIAYFGDKKNPLCYFDLNLNNL